MIELPSPQLESRVSLEETIVRRRSVRTYRSEPLDLAQLSQVLWAAQGLTRTRRFRAAPSARGTYPLEIFVVVGKRSIVASEAGQGVQELETGISDDGVDSHSLSLHRPSDVRPELARAAPIQQSIVEAQVDIVTFALFHRTSCRYGSRAERYVHMKVGYVGENIHLQDVVLGLATVEVGAFDDEEMRAVLGVDGQIRPLYIMPMGRSS
jgi:SagB-type dehydrogenase family enzyme